MRPSRSSTRAVSSRMSLERQRSNEPCSAKRRRSNDTPPLMGFRKALTNTVVSSTALAMLSFSARRLHLQGQTLLLGGDLFAWIGLQVCDLRGSMHNSLPCAITLDH